MKKLILSLSALACLGSSAFAKAPNPNETRPLQFEFVAWSTDSQYVLVKVTDANMPTPVFQVRDAKGELVKMGKKAAAFPSQHAPRSEAEEKFVKQLRSGQKIKIDNQPVVFDQDGVFEAMHPRRNDVMLMTGQKKDKLVIMGLRDGAASEYDAIELMTDGKKNYAKASTKTFAWDQSGKHFVLIYNQKLATPDAHFDGDFIQITPFRSYKVQGSGSDEE